jgi:hypothetical protein
MRTLAGPTASIAFTNLSSATSATLSAAFSDTNVSDSDSAQAQAQAECHKQGVQALMKSRDIDIPLEQVCLLDPKASLALTPSDGDAGKFTWFLFGVRPVPPSIALPSFLPSPLSHPPSHFLCCGSALFLVGRSDGMGFRVSSVRLYAIKKKTLGRRMRDEVPDS